MVLPERFAALSDGLAAGVSARADLTGLVLLGSASDAGAPRRDDWSDHDFFAIIRAGQGPTFRPDLSWLPEQERIVLTAREGEIGFVAVYDDGHVMEFALAEAAELAEAVVGDATVRVDDADGTLAALVARGQAKVAAADSFDPVNDARLVLVKLLIGVGRARRGETVSASMFVRAWAVQHLIRAVRGRRAEQSGTLRDAIDPQRRFERDFPGIAAQIEAGLARPLEDAGRALFTLLRQELEPGWDEFPSRAADAVAARLGW